MAQQQRQVLAMLLLATLAAHSDFGCGASVQVHHQSGGSNQQSSADYLPSNSNGNDKEQEKLEQLKIPKDQTLVVRLPSNTLLKYTSYKDVSILHFRMPADTRSALFTFKAFEEAKSAFQRKCTPRDVTLHLKASSYPVISPENITFPRNFLNADQRYKIYDLQFKSDEQQQRITIEGPQVGNWFAVAFVSWTDPNNDRIEQQGLAASCDTLLLAEMSVTRFQPIIINNGQVHNGNLTSNNVQLTNNTNNNSYKQKNSNRTSTQNADSNKTANAAATAAGASKEKNKRAVNGDEATSTQNETRQLHQNIYKFFVQPQVGVATARITVRSICAHCPDVGFYVQANAYPRSASSDEGAASEDEEDESITSYAHSIFKPNQTGELTFEFYVQPSMWHYAYLKFMPPPPVARRPPLMGELKLLNELPLRDVSESATSYNYGGGNRLRRQNPLHLAEATTTNETVWYELDYALRIDFLEPAMEMADVDKEPIDTTTTTAKPAEVSKETAKEEATNSTDSNQSNAWKPLRFRDMEFYPLLRQTYREFFMFDYDLVPDANGTVPTVLNLTAGTPAGFSFDVGEVYDIGGTLSFAVSMKHGLKGGAYELRAVPPAAPAAERNGILAEKLIGRPVGADDSSSKGKDDAEEDDKALPRSNQTIIVCMHLGEPGEPTWPDKCRYGRKLLPASSIVNNTDSNTSTGLVHVPFPESGQWYITMGLYCHGAETAARVTIIDSVKEFVKRYASMLEDIRPPCACASGATRYRACVAERKCLAALNETETLKLKECLMDSKCTPNYVEMTRRFEAHHKLATEQHFALDNCNTSVVFTVSSSPCVAGRCGRFGRCYHYMSGGFVFSTCVCLKGYRGWDCTEDTQVPSSMSILAASLLLTLSNLLFFPSIYMAMRRKYYTEAVIYFFAMFFSIFYHACDSGEDEYSFCLVKIGVLQFCDFYCGLLAIWVTLVAMAHVRQQFVSLLHMFGAILLAFGTELNKQSLWVFLAPALTGICLISASWGLRCYKSRKWFPARKYLTLYMPLGMVLVMVGLICYAFLQTKQNYHIVHSIWHMVMALSILCLLPSRKSFAPKC